MKKLICLFICLALASSLFVMPGVSAESVPVITVDSVTAGQGETVCIDISIRNNPGIVSMTLKVAYDASVLTLIGVEDGGILGTQSHKPQYSNPYTLVWVNDTVTTNFTSNGVIARLRFSVDEFAVDGGEYPVSVSYNNENYDIYNKDIECVDFDIVDGLVSIRNEIPATPITDFSYRFVSTGICITGYKGSATDLLIAETYEINGVEHKVSMIDESAFEASETLESISLPATIESIGDYAFYDCRALKNVTLWSKYATIGEQAFGYYYISRKVDGKVDGFALTAYNGSTVQQYLLENDMSYVSQTKPVGKGDVDADGEYSASDLTTICNHLLSVLSLGEDKFDAGDLNNDGNVNILDLIALKKQIAKLV